MAKSNAKNKKSKKVEIPVDDSKAKEKILNVAMELFAEKGLDGTTTREIASASGLNLSLISYYFGGKEGLYKAVISNFAQVAHKAIHGVLNPERDNVVSKETLRAHMEELVDAIFSVKMSYPHMHTILRKEVSMKLPYSRDVYEEIFAPIGHQLAEFFVRAQKKGIVRKDLDPVFFVVVFIESIQGYFASQDCGTSLKPHFLKLPEQADVLKKQIIDLFTKGILI